MREPRILVSSDSFSRAAMFLAGSEGDSVRDTSSVASASLSLSMLGYQEMDEGDAKDHDNNTEKSATSDAVLRVKEFGEKVPHKFCTRMGSALYSMPMAWYCAI